MGKINVLSFAVANLIAAGEVVDRPASVIKELLENSVDAGANNITVEIQNGGVTFMRVTDNGCGMEKDDMPIAIKRHATSKIKNAEDLDGILTLGFRGEALAAISSVSHIRIISKTKNNEFGTMLEASAGEITSISERGCSDGTTVIVEGLFENVPARRKFLKKDATEAMAVSVVVEKIALSRPDIAIKLIVDGNVKLQTVGDGSIKNTVYSVFGRDFASRIIEVDGESDGIKIKGFIGRSDNVKANRNYQNFFINGRYVKCKTACAAIEQAYTSYIPPEKFPACVLYIDINPKIVDVNVHPAKLEVKFSNEKPVFEAIYYSVRSALEQNVSRPEMSLPINKTPPKNNNIPISRSFVPIIDRSDRTPMSQRQVKIEDIAPIKKTSADSVTTTQHISFAPPPTHRIIERVPAINESTSQEKNTERTIITAPSVVKPIASEEPPVVVHYKFIGEVFNSYIIVECDDKMLLIDKHAAHERIIFEDRKRKLKEAENSSQLLIVPIVVQLSREEFHSAIEFSKHFSDLGFDIVFDEQNSLLNVVQIPIGLDQNDIPDLITSMVGNILAGGSDPALTCDIILEKSLYQISCKAAIKAGRVYPIEYNEWIIDKLSRIPNITFCPHGRPIAMELSKTYIDKQFSRL